jgi:DNA polymerase III delta prime subunit
MENSSSYVFFLSSGIGLYAAMYLWRKGATRWGTWFPLLRKSLEWGLIGLAAGIALYALFTAANGPLPSGHALFALALGLAAPELYRRLRGDKASEVDETQRGSEVVSSQEVAKRIKASKQKTFIELGGVPIPESAEPYHFLIAGSTGTGKSVAIHTLLSKIRERGDTAILVDSGGDFLSKHFNAKTDFVFNPFDERCVGWSPTLEMQGSWDAQALARSIVPDGIGDSREWNSYAQTFVGSVLRKLWEAQRLTLADFLYFVQVAPVKELKILLEGTPAISQMGSEKMFGSIRTIASNYLTSYDYLPTDRDPFSLTQMVQAEHSGVLFVTYRDDQLDALRNIIASLLDVASRAVLSLEPNPNRRIWLIIDEFASIGRVQSVEAVATKARKAGGCLVLGIQSISQLKDRYGDNGAQTILSCLSSWLVLRCSDADTSEYMSRYIGEAEVSRSQLGKSSGDTGDSNSVSEQRLTKRVVLGSEIQQFENLHGLLKLAGGMPVCSVKLALPPPPKGSGKAFVPRDFCKRPLLKLQAQVDVADEGADEAGTQSPAPAAAPRAAAPSAPAAPAQVGKTVSAAAFDRFVRRQDEAPVSKNLLVEMSRGVPTLAERMRQMAVQRAAPVPAPAKPRGPVSVVQMVAAPKPVAIAALATAVAAAARPDLKALAAKVLAAQAEKPVLSEVSLAPATQASTASPARPAEMAPAPSPPVLAAPGEPTLQKLAEKAVGKAAAKAREQQSDTRTQDERANALDESRQADDATSGRRKRRNRRGPTREELGDLLR